MLRSEKRNARSLLKAFNATLPDDTKKRTVILKELLGELGTQIEIELPFYCDYDYNIPIGDNFYVSFNCIFLDCASIIIGDNVFMGPNVQIYTTTHPFAIEDNVWICGDVIISQAATIAEGQPSGRAV